VVRLAQAQSARLLAEADARGLPGQDGHARWEPWLRAQVPTASPRGAAVLARRAERLFAGPVAADLAPTREAMLSACLSGEQVDVVSVTIATMCPPVCPPETVDAGTLAEAQQVLLEHAQVFDPTRLRTIAGRRRDRLDPGAALSTALDAWSAPGAAVDGTPDHRPGALRGVSGCGDRHLAARPGPGNAAGCHLAVGVHP
jgi:hypothetical protein